LASTVHQLDLAADHVHLPGQAGDRLGQATGHRGHRLGGLAKLSRGDFGVLVELGPERPEGRLRAALDPGDLLVQLRGVLGQLGDGLVQAVEPARRRLHALLQLAHALLQPGQPFALRRHGVHDLAGPLTQLLQLGQRLLDVLRHGAHVRPQCGQLGQRRHLGAQQLDVLGQRLGPGRRPRRGRRQLPGQLVQPGVQAADLPVPDLLGQPLQPFQPLTDIIERTRVRPLVRHVVLNGAREQLAHAVSGASLVPAQQDVVARLIHDAPLRGSACSMATTGRCGWRQDPITLVSISNQLCTQSENASSAAGWSRLTCLASPPNVQD
jgi:hypothetical protein